MLLFPTFLCTFAREFFLCGQGDTSLLDSCPASRLALFENPRFSILSSTGKLEFSRPLSSPILPENKEIIFVRPGRIGLPPQSWQDRVLPLNYGRIRTSLSKMVIHSNILVFKNLLVIPILQLPYRDFFVFAFLFRIMFFVN